MESKKFGHYLALVHWYQFKHANTPSKFYLYDCPYVEFVDEYCFIPLESINEIVHVVPWFGLNNSYFINKFIF
jgi:hypothetical protein